MLIDALHFRNRSRPPVWLMRQAGRYLPSYRALRKKYSFHEMSHQPELAVEVTLLPFSEFELDAAILFSDILVILEAFGESFQIVEGKGPVIDSPIRDTESVKALPKPLVEEKLSYVFETIRLLKPQLKVPLLGFCGAPFTVASYLIEGGTTKQFKHSKSWMFKDPEGFHLLLDKLTNASITYMQLQKKAGVDAFQVFDTWAVALSPEQFSNFCVPYLKKMVDAAKKIDLPIVLFTKGSFMHAEKLAHLKPNGLSVDWTVSIPDLRKKIGPEIALQGNFDPSLLYAPPPVIQKEVKKLLSAMKNDFGYISNLGHGLLPDIPVEGVRAFVEAVQSN